MVSLSCPAAAGAEGRDGGESEREAPGRRSSQASSPRRSGPFIPRLFSPKPRHPCRSDCRRRAPRLRSSNVTPFSPHNRPDLSTCSYALAAFHVRSLPSRVRDELVSQAKELHSRRVCSCASAQEARAAVESSFEADCCCENDEAGLGACQYGGALLQRAALDKGCIEQARGAAGGKRE